MNSPKECTTAMFKSSLELMNAKVSKFARENFQHDDGSLDPFRCTEFLVEYLKELDLFFSFNSEDVLIETSQCVYLKDQISEYGDINGSSMSLKGIEDLDKATMNSCVDIMIKDQKFIVLLSLSEGNLRECYQNLTAYDSTRCGAEMDPDDVAANAAFKKAEQTISDSMAGIKFAVGKAISIDEACSLLASKFSKKDCDEFNFKVEEYLLKSI